MQMVQKVRFLVFLPLCAALAILPGCHRAPKKNLKLSDESGAVVATFSGVELFPTDPGCYMVKVSDADKGRLESVSKANLGKQMTIEVSGVPAQKATMMSPLKDGSFNFGSAAPVGSVEELLKPFKPEK